MKGSEQNLQKAKSFFIFFRCLILGYHRAKMVNLAIILSRTKWSFCHQNWLFSWYVVVDTWHTVFFVLWYPIVKSLVLFWPLHMWFGYVLSLSHNLIVKMHSCRCATINHSTIFKLSKHLETICNFLYMLYNNAIYCIMNTFLPLFLWGCLVIRTYMTFQVPCRPTITLSFYFGLENKQLQECQ